MPVQHGWDRGVLIIVGEGYYPFEDLKGPIRAAIASDPDHAPFMLLADLSKSESILRRSTHEIVKGARALTLCRSHIRKAAAVVGSTAAYGIARMGQAYISLGGLDAGVFWTREEAIAWLLEGSPPSDAVPGQTEPVSELPTPRPA